MYSCRKKAKKDARLSCTGT